MAHDEDPALALAAQLCSKLCHDLAGVLGAIANGTELLAEEDDEAIRRQAIDLVAQSAEQAGRRLRFFRIAFGAGASLGEKLDLAEIKEAAEGQFGGGRTRLEWPAGGGAIAKSDAKLLANLLLIAAAGLPRGGVLRTVFGPGQPCSVTAEGDGAKLPEAAQAGLAGMGGMGEGMAAIGAHASRLAQAAGWQIACEANPGAAFTMRAVPR